MLYRTTLAVAAVIVFGTAFAVQASSKHDGKGANHRVAPQGQSLGGPPAWRGAPPDAYVRGNGAYGYGSGAYGAYGYGPGAYGAYGYGPGAYGAFAGPRPSRCPPVGSERPELAIQDRFYLESQGVAC